MNRLQVTVIILFVLVVLNVGAAPIGLDLGLEMGAADTLTEEDFQIYVQPQVSYALGDTGFRAGFAWEVPILPEADIGTLEAWEEYEILVPRIVVTIGNDNALSLDSADLEGYLYSIAGYSIGDFTLELELDFGYAPEFLVDAVPCLSFEKDLGPGSLAFGVSHNLELYDRFEPGDTEFSVSFETTLRGFGITFEIEPVITSDGEFNLSALTLVEFFL